MKVIIGGFTGSGKTTVYKKLRELGKDQLFDLDHEFFAFNGQSPNEMIREKGMESFRKAESQLLFQLMRTESKYMIFLGGGTLSPEVARSIESEREVKTFWLQREFEKCWDTIKNDGERPIVDLGRDECLKLYTERTNIAFEFSWRSMSIKPLIESLLNLPEPA